MNNVIKEVLKKINEAGYEAYIVGGYVRDFLLGDFSNDIDICTNGTIKELLNIFNGKVNDCGSLNLKVNDFNIDITTFREESSYKNRRPTNIIYIEDLENDLKRRDFTINAICMNKEGKIIDYLNGVNDLHKGVVKAIGDPLKKLKDDPLRILRAIRFATILNFDIDESLNKAIFEVASLIKSLSYYRIKNEISKILLSVNYQIGLDLLKKYQLTDYLNISYKHLVYTKDLCGMWAQIDYPDCFPFTKNEKNTIVKLREILNTGFINKEIIYKYGLYLSLVAGEILGIDVNFIYSLHHNMPINVRKDLNITYLEIVDILNVEPSSFVKEIENDLVCEVLNERINNSFEEIREFLVDNKERWIKE